MNTIVPLFTLIVVILFAYGIIWGIISVWLWAFS